MQNKEIAQAIIDAPETTSWKIRELAKSGFLRTEIRDLLEIRYQHVQGVLIKSGIGGGKTSSTNKSVDTALNNQNMEPYVPEFNWRKLTECGFISVGEWVTDQDEIVLNGEIPTEPGVYAFILDGQVAYVGLTQSSLKNRMYHYRIGHYRQRTSSRVKELIKSALAEGLSVRILICTPDNLEWNGLPVHTAPGLEAGLISLIKPIWNIQGKT